MEKKVSIQPKLYTPNKCQSTFHCIECARKKSIKFVWFWNLPAATTENMTKNFFNISTITNDWSYDVVWVFEWQTLRECVFFLSFCSFLILYRLYSSILSSFNCVCVSHLFSRDTHRLPQRAHTHAQHMRTFRRTDGTAWNCEKCQWMRCQLHAV